MSRQPDVVTGRQAAGAAFVLTVCACLLFTRAAATAPAQKISHFECYAIATEDDFERRSVVLADQFERRKAEVLRPESLCNPVRKNTTAPTDRAAHLVCYRIATDRMTPRDVLVSNQFGRLRLRAVLPYSLCLPSGKSRTEEPAPVPERLDHYECYRVRPLSTHKKPQVSLVDQFWRTKAVVLSVFSLCNPVSKNRSRIVNKTDHLVCYRIRTDGFRPRKVVVSNQFDKARRLEATAPTTLCLPSLKRVLKPDLTVQIVPKLTGAHIPVSCPSGAGSCKTTVEYRIRNLTAVAVTTGFQVKLGADPGMSITKTLASFPASGSMTFTEVFGPGGNCYDPDCTVSVTVDSGSTIAESNEANNTDTYTVRG